MANKDRHASAEPLVQAALENNLDLLRQSFPESSRDERVWALANAAAQGHVAAVRELLALEVDPNGQTEIQGLAQVAPPLYQALRHGHSAIARMLVEAGARTDATEPLNGHSMLAELVHDFAPLAILGEALELGADVNDGGRSGYTPLGAALYRSRSAVAQWLVERGADPNQGRTIWDAFTFGGIVPLRLVIEAGADIGQRHGHGRTLLELAAEYNRPLHFDYLLSKGSDLSTIEQSLPLAASAGLTHAVSNLLAEQGQPVDQPDRHGRTPLAMSVASNRTDVIRTLLEAGADPNQRFRCQWQEPDWGAMQAFHHQLEAWDEDQASLLTIAVFQENHVATALLLDAGADPNIASCGWTPLHFACVQGHPALAELLLLGGADPEVRNEQGNTPLLIAVDCEQLKAFRVLREFGANLHALDEEGYSALATAALKGHAELVRTLLDEGLDPNQPTRSGFTPLMNAAEACHLEAVCALLRSGADPTLRDPEGRTALDIATQLRDAGEPGDEEEWDGLLKILGAQS